MGKNKGVCPLLYIYRMLKKALQLQIMSPCEKERIDMPKLLPGGNHGIIFSVPELPHR